MTEATDTKVEKEEKRGIRGMHLFNPDYKNSITVDESKILESLGMLVDYHGNFHYGVIIRNDKEIPGVTGKARVFQSPVIEITKNAKPYFTNPSEAEINFAGFVKNAKADAEIKENYKKSYNVDYDEMMEAYNILAEEMGVEEAFMAAICKSENTAAIKKNQMKDYIENVKKYANQVIGNEDERLKRHAEILASNDYVLSISESDLNVDFEKLIGKKAAEEKITKGNETQDSEEQINYIGNIPEKVKKIIQGVLSETSRSEQKYGGLTIPDAAKQLPEDKDYVANTNEKQIQTPEQPKVTESTTIKREEQPADHSKYDIDFNSSDVIQDMSKLFSDAFDGLPLSEKNIQYNYINSINYETAFLRTVFFELDKNPEIHQQKGKFAEIVSKYAQAVNKTFDLLERVDYPRLQEILGFYERSVAFLKQHETPLPYLRAADRVQDAIDKGEYGDDVKGLIFCGSKGLFRQREL